jgi:hypothetical protein
MKNLLLALFIFSLLSCKKDKQEDLFITNIVGNWKAIQWQNDIGNGSTPFTDIPPQYNYYMNFKPNNDFETNYILVSNDYNRYKIVDALRVTLYKQNSIDSTNILYSFDNEKLIIGFPCIEPCRLKLVRN